MKKIIIILITLFIISGCSNYKELNDLGIVTALGFKKNDDNLYEVSIQLINVIEEGNNGISESPITVLTGTGKTLFDAGRELNKKSSKVFFLANLEYVLLDKSVLNENLHEVLDYLTREERLSLNYIVVTSIDNTPEEILSNISKLDIVPATNITNILELSEKRLGTAVKLDIKTLLNNYLSNITTPVYPNLKIHGEVDETTSIDSLNDSNNNNYIYVKDLIFLNNNEIIHLNDNEIYGYNFINNNIENASITIPCEDNYFTIETLTSNFNYKDILKNNTLKITGDIDAEIVYYGCSYNLEDNSTLKELTNKSINKIKSYLESSINLAKLYNKDYIGIGEFIYKNNYKYFNKVNWKESSINNINYEYDININLYKQGNLRGDI